MDVRLKLASFTVAFSGVSGVDISTVCYEMTLQSQIFRESITHVKQQFVVTHRYTVLLQVTETTSTQPVDQCKYVIFLGRYKEKQFFFMWAHQFDRRCACNPTV